MAEGNRETQSTSWDPMHTAETMVLKTPAQNEHSLIKLVPGESPHGRSMTQVSQRSRRQAVSFLVGTFLMISTVQAGPTLGPDTGHDFMAMAIGRSLYEHEATELELAWMPSVSRYCGAMPPAETPLN